jgi:hypothetical protein
VPSIRVCRKRRPICTSNGRRASWRGVASTDGFAPNGLTSALQRTDTPFGAAAADFAKDARARVDGISKLEKIAAQAEPPPRERAETIGKMLMSGMLKVGAGPNGNAALQKRAATRRFPAMHDEPMTDRSAPATAVPQNPRAVNPSLFRS